MFFQRLSSFGEWFVKTDERFQKVKWEDVACIMGHQLIMGIFIPLTYHELSPEYKSWNLVLAAMITLVFVAFRWKFYGRSHCPYRFISEIAFTFPSLIFPHLLMVVIPLQLPLIYRDRQLVKRGEM